MNGMPYYARIIRDDTGERRQLLTDHLRQTALMTEWLLAPLGLGKIGYLAGILHDIGKTRPGFVALLAQASKPKTHDTDSADPSARGDSKSHHSGMGGRWAYNFLRERVKAHDYTSLLLAQMIAHAICGHHRGVYDISSEDADTPSLDGILSGTEPEDLDRTFAAGLVSLELINAAVGETDELFLRVASYRGGKELEKDDNFLMFVLGQYCRMLHTALCLADRTDAMFFSTGLPFEENFTRFQKTFASFGQDTWDSLAGKLDVRLDSLTNPCDGRTRPCRLLQWKARLSDVCFGKGAGNKGIYFLDAPTGSGKTLASARFALRHAQVRNMRRIVYFLPLLTLTEQTAGTFRDIFGRGSVCEHYSGAVKQKSHGEDDAPGSVLRKEWDKPVVVSTLYRFFEIFMSGDIGDKSLIFALKDAVIIADEIQSVPKRLLGLFQYFMRFLVEQMGCTVLLSTATNPLVKSNSRIALDYTLVVPEQDTEKMRRCFDNVKIRFIGRRRESVGSPYRLKEYPPEEIAGKIAGIIRKKQLRSFLLVVNTVRQAQHMAELMRETMPECDVFFLSASLCHAHRKNIYKRMSAAMKAGERTVVCVATKVIEAGVDISFHGGMKFLEGYDSIMQFAGRVNRYGEFGRRAVAYVIKAQEEEAASLAELWAGKRDTDNLATCAGTDTDNRYGLLDSFVRRKYGGGDEQWSEYNCPLPGTEKKHNMINILGLNKGKRLGNAPYRLCQDFSRAERNFVVYDNAGIPVIVPYDNRARNIIRQLTGKYPCSFGSIARYTINLYPEKLQEMIDKGLVYEIETKYGIIYAASVYNEDGMPKENDAVMIV